MVIQMGSSKGEQTINNFIESNRIVFFAAESPSTRKRAKIAPIPTCFVSFHRIPFGGILNYRCIASRGMFRL